MKLYIAGPIRGEDPKKCVTSFDITEGELRNCGYDVFNPITDHKYLLERADVLTMEELKQIFREDISALLICDGVALLGEWQESRGACGEYWIAQACKMPTLSVDQWKDVSYVEKSIRKQQEERSVCIRCGQKVPEDKR